MEGGFCEQWPRQRESSLAVLYYDISYLSIYLYYIYIYIYIYIYMCVCVCVCVCVCLFFFFGGGGEGGRDDFEGSESFRGLRAELLCFRAASVCARLLLHFLFSSAGRCGP